MSNFPTFEELEQMDSNPAPSSKGGNFPTFEELERDGNGGVSDIGEDSPDFIPGVKRGIDQTQGMFYGAAALAGGAMGLDDVEEWGMEGYRRNMAEAGENPAKHTFKDVYTGKAGVGGSIDWFQGTLGEIVPSMVEAAVGAVVGGVVGSSTAPGPGTVVGAGVGGFASRTILKKAIEKGVKEGTEKVIKNQIAKGIFKEGSEAIIASELKKQVTKQSLKKLGSKIGIGAAVLPLESGGNYAGLLEEHGVSAPATSLLLGAVATSFEFIPGGNAKLVDTVIDAIGTGNGGLIKRAFKNLLTGVPSESFQEGGQGALQILNTVVNTDEKFLTPENLEEIVENMGAGAVGGVGGATVQTAFPGPGKAGPGKDEKQNLLDPGETSMSAMEQAEALQSSIEMAPSETAVSDPNQNPFSEQAQAQAHAYATRQDQDFQNGITPEKAPSQTRSIPSLSRGPGAYSIHPSDQAQDSQDAMGGITPENQEWEQLKADILEQRRVLQENQAKATDETRRTDKVAQAQADLATANAKGNTSAFDMVMFANRDRNQQAINSVYSQPTPMNEGAAEVQTGINTFRRDQSAKALEEHQANRQGLKPVPSAGQVQAESAMDGFEQRAGQERPGEPVILEDQPIDLNTPIIEFSEPDIVRVGTVEHEKPSAFDSIANRLGGKEKIRPQNPKYPFGSAGQVKADAAENRFNERDDKSPQGDPDYIDTGATKTTLPIIESSEPTIILTDRQKEEHKAYDPFERITQRLGGKTGPVRQQSHVEAVEIAAQNAELSEVNTDPSEKQKEAGNYQKGHIKVHGLDIAVENPGGSVRKGVDGQGNEWETTMQDHYGYFKRTMGKDKDQVDVFVKPGTLMSPKIYVVDQVDPGTGKFDEHKVVMGASSESEAREIYNRNYDEGWQGLGAITEMGPDDFKAWLKDGKRTKKPLAGKTLTKDADKGNSVPVTKDQGKAENIPTVKTPLADGGAAEIIREIESATKEPTIINGYPVKRWRGRPDYDYKVQVKKYSTKRWMVFPGVESLADFVSGIITGLTFYNPISVGKEIPITEDADYRGQDEEWLERPTGEETLTEPLVGYHYSSDDKKAFREKETAFYTSPTKRYTPENSFKITVPVGKTVTFYDDEFRVDLDSEMKIERLKEGWSPHVKNYYAENDRNYIGHKDKFTDLPPPTQSSTPAEGVQNSPATVDSEKRSDTTEKDNEKPGTSKGPQGNTGTASLPEKLVEKKIDELLFAPVKTGGKSRYEFKTKTEQRDFSNGFKKGFEGGPVPKITGIAQKFQDAATRGWEQGRVFKQAQGKVKTPIAPTEDNKKPTQGNTGTAFLPDNTPVKFVYEIVELSDILSSHDTDMKINPDYPSELQPRDRTRVGSLAQVQKIAKSLNPQRLMENTSAAHGAPIISKDNNVVESGNGRVIALDIAYGPDGDKRKGQFYKKTLGVKLESLGFDSGSLNEMERPVLVRRRTTKIEDLVSFVQKANETEVAKMSPAEQAKVDAGNLTKEDMAHFHPSKDGNLAASSNQTFVSRFLKKMSAEESSGYMTAGGTPTRQLIDRMQAAVFQKAYGSDELLSMMAEDADPDIKNILNGLVTAAGDFALAQTHDKAMALETAQVIVDGINYIRQAQKDYPNLKAIPGKSKVLAQVNQALAQQDVFGEKTSKDVKRVAQTLAWNVRSGKKIGEFIGYIGSAMRESFAELNQSVIFGDKENLSPGLFINKALHNMENSDNGGQKTLFGSNNESGAEKPLPGDNPEQGGQEDERKPKRGRDPHSNPTEGQKPQEVKPPVEDSENLIDISPEDLDYQQAYDAHQGTSHVPEDRAKQEQQGYYLHIKSVQDKFLKRIKPEQRLTLEAELRIYKAGYLKKYGAVLSARSKTMSSMITGPSNFPTARNQKALNTEQKRYEELKTWDKKAQNAIKRELGLSGVISGDDPQAIKKLKEKLANLEESHQMMKDANVITRNKKLSDKEKVKALVELGLSDKMAIEAMTPDYRGKIGFASYALSNNNANIKNVKTRIAALEEQAGDETTTIKIGDVEIIDNVEDNRVQIVFDGKPSEEIRKDLKSNGFRWAPSTGAWQRKRGNHASYLANAVVGRIEKTNDVSKFSTNQDTAQYSISSVKPWAKDFPPIYGHTSTAALKKHPDYEKAKAGDLESAARVVSDLIKVDRVKELGKQFPKAEVVAVHAEEASGLNKIPRAITRAIAHIGGLSVNTDIVQSYRAKHTDKGSSGRMITRAEFDGPVKKGQEYIIVDDVVAQGGTMSELRHYIENNGGKVVAISSLSYARGSGKLDIQPETISTLKKRFSENELEGLLQEYNVTGTIDALTEREGRYLLRFKSLDSIRDKFSEARQQGSGQVLYSLLQRESSDLNSPILPGQGVSLKDIQSRFQGQQVFLTPDGQISIRLENGLGLRVVTAKEIGGADHQFAVDTGRMGEDGVILGKYESQTITLSEDLASNFTRDHEIYHFLKAMGMITKNDVMVLTGARGKMDLTFKLSDIREENEANTFAQLLQAREQYRGTRVGDILQKIMDFLDGLLHIGRMSARKLAREVETGKIFSREAKGQASSGAQFQTTDRTNTLTKAFKKWFKNSKVVDENGDPLKVFHGTISTENFTEFSPSKVGSGTVGQDASDSFFFTSSPETSDSYSNPIRQGFDLNGGATVLDKLGKAYSKAMSELDSWNDNGLEDYGISHESGVLSLYDNTESDTVKEAAKIAWKEVYGKDLSKLSYQEFADLGKSVSVDYKTFGVPEGKTYPVYLSIKNPLMVDFKGLEFDSERFASKIQEAKDRGNDGVIFKNVIDHGDITDAGAADTYVAFKPTQIKSVFNKGTWDGTNPDIRYSTTADRTYTPAQTDYKTTGGFGNRTKETYKQRFDQAKVLAGDKLRQGMVDQFHSLNKVLGDKKAWMMAHLTKSDTGALMAAINTGMPFLHSSGAIDIKEGSKSLKEILAPLGNEMDDFLAWIAANRSEKLLAEDRENRFTADQIKAGKTLNQGTLKDGSSRGELYNNVRKDFEELGAAITDIAVKTNLVNEEEAQQWKEEGFYVPFYRMLEEQETSRRGPGNIGGLTNQKAYKKLKGADLGIDDLLTNTLLNWNHLISAGLRNQAGKKALESAADMGLAGIVPKAIKSKDAVYIRDNGQEVWYELDNTPESQLVLDSILSLSYEGLNTPAMKGMRMFKRVLTRGVTASPGFKIRNLIRDSMHAPAVTTVSKNPLKNIAVGIKDRAAMKRMEAGGGAFSQEGYIHGSDPDAMKNIVGLSVDSILNTPRKIANMWRKYEDFGNTLENINRVASFKNDLAKGKSLLEANFNARDQLDFARSGSFSSVRVLTQVIPFLNARMQGLDKIGRAAMDPAQRNQFAQVVGMYTLASVSLMLAMADDDDYDEAPEWEKRTYHLFKIPGVDKMFRIPRPFEVGAIAYMNEQMARQFVDANAEIKDIGSAIYHTLSDTFAVSIVPQAFKPLLEIYANKDSFRNTPIESMSMQRLSKKERSKPWTSDVAKGTSSAMSEVLPEGATLSPVQIQHLVRAYTGWAGATTLASIDFLIKKINGDITPETKLSEYTWNPVSSFARDSEAKSSKYVTQFYDNMSELNTMWADIRKYRGTPGGKKITAEQISKLRHRKMYNNLSKQLSTLRKQEEFIYKNTSMKAEWKRAKLEIIRKQKNDLTKRAIMVSKDVL